MDKFHIIGAGMAGLVAGAFLREQAKCIWEAQSGIPNNHSALLRFRSSVIGDVLNIPFKPVDVMKAVVTTGNPVRDAVLYSIKTTGTPAIRSIVSAQGTIDKRWIAPRNFIGYLSNAVHCPVEFDKYFTLNTIKEIGDDPIISTIPMPILATLLGYNELPHFYVATGWTITADLNDSDVYATLYIPGHESKAYRASITGNKLIVEYAFPNMSEDASEAAMHKVKDYPNELKKELHLILSMFGLTTDRLATAVPKVKKQSYAKIMPIDDDARKRFIIWATDQHNIFALGRFATWRPGLMVDDLINDLRVIQKVSGGSNYDLKK